MTGDMVPCSVCGEPTSTLKRAIWYTRVTHVKHPGCHHAVEAPLPSVPMLRALTALANAGVPRGLHPSTRRALLARGLVKAHETVLVITPAGRDALAIPHPEKAWFLARKAGDGERPGYTTNPARAIDDLETVDDQTLEFFTADAHERWAGQPGRRVEQARRRLRTVGDRLKRLSIAGLDVSPELEELERQLGYLERHEDAAA